MIEIPCYVEERHTWCFRVGRSSRNLDALVLKLDMGSLNGEV